MNHSKDQPLSEAPRFREGEAIKLWSARIDVQLPYTEFGRVIMGTARKNGQRYTGFVTKDAKENVTSFTRTRYPRKEYGVASVRDCQQGLATLAKELNSTVTAEAQQQGLRVLLGLREGYDDQAPTHSLPEVQQALPGANVTAAEVFSIRSTKDDISIYSEPVAVIKAPVTMVHDIYMLADRLKQERFTIENFDQNIAYMVETRFCTKPD